MIKVKDGYAKLIGTTYQGSATQVLLSNGGDLEYSASSKASTLVQRNASQHIYATYFNSAISDEALTDIGSVYVRNTSDTFIRRVSKTQFYSILDDKFVTLDTTQSITGAKTFSTSVRFANNASIIQNQNDTSNYTTILKWYKNGASRNTYDPSIGQHNTGGDGNGSICILPYPTETSPWGGTVGLFISKGVLKLDGKSVALAENYYTKTESDERYVNVTGDTMTGPLIVKAAITGTQLISTIATGTSPLKVTSTTVVTNLNSDLLDGLHETSFFRARGDQSIASSVPTTTELATSNNLCGSWNVKYTGASGHLVQFNAGSGSTRYMQFYSMYSGSLYWRNSTDSTLNTKSWKTIVDSANYTGIVLKIGTATKGSATLPIYLNAGTPTACSTTLGVSITGNAATATKLQTARTINGTSFDGTANIVTAYWGTARTISLSGAVTGSASVNGSQNVTITTTYQTGSIDGRYVGGNKTANHGSSGTAYTADSYSSTFARKEFVAFAERGSWAYANNGYVTTDTGVNIPLAGTAVFQWGASDTNKTQLFITPHNNSGVSNPAANEMLFYTSNGSGYTSAWTRVLTHRNYTAYTVTKTGGGASGTWGISITGSAPWANITGKPTLLTLAGITSLTNKDLNYARYNFGTTNKGDDSTQLNVPANYGLYLSLAYSDKNQGGQIFFNTVPGTTGTLYFRTRNAGDGNTVNTWKSWKTVLDSTNYTAYFNPANYVTALGTSGNYVTWTKNGATNNLTVPYATKANRLTLVSCYNGTTNNDLWSTIKTANSTYTGTATIYEVYNDGGPTTYGEVLDIVSIHSNHWQPQLWFDSGKTGSIRHRNKDYNNNTWGSWYVLLDNNNYAGTLDSRYVTLTTNQTVSGIKTFSTQQKFTVATGTSPFTVSSTTVVGNLNSDMLDGYHAASFYQYGYVMFARTIDASALSTSTYYPVTFSIESHSNVRIECRVSLNSGTKPSWSTHAKGFSVRKIWEVNGSGWGTNPINRRILVSDYAFADSDPVRGVGQLSNSSVEYVYVRGGGKYLFYISHNISATLHTSTYTIKSQSVAPTTSAPAAISTPTLTFSAGKFSALSYKPLTGINTVNIPTNTSHLTNDSGFWTGTRYWANVAVSTASSTSTQPTFNTCYTSNWFRSTGSTGWHSETYGGGWYMTDSTWIRTYGSKSVYQNTGQIRTDGYLVTNGGITVGATSPNNGTYKSHVTGNSWSSGYIRAGAGFYHNSVNSNNYVLLAGGSYKSLADFAKGNAGASNRGVYVTNGTVTAMTYYLNATINSGASGKLAYYRDTNSIDYYASTVGSSNRGVYVTNGTVTAMTYYLNATIDSGAYGRLAYYRGTNYIDDYASTVGSSGIPIYLSRGVPTACTGVMVKYWASYTINNYSGTSVAYYKNGGNYNFVTSASRRDTGRYTIGTVYPSGQTWYTTLVWAVGNLNASDSSNSSNSLLYCTLIRGYNSGSTYYWYVNTADDASTNDGSFELFFLCF